MQHLPRLAVALTALVPLAAQEKGFKGPLPIIHGVSDEVPKKKTVVVEMRADGTVVHDGKTIGVGALRERLAAFAEKHPDKSRRPFEFGKQKRFLSLGQLHVRMHPNVPYEAFHRLLSLCAAPPVMMHRIFLGARAKSGGSEHAVPVFLPIDHGGEAQPWTVHAELDYGKPPTSRKMIDLRLSKIQPIRGKHPRLRVSPEPRMPIAHVLEVVQAARLAGFDEFAFNHRGSFDYPEWAKGTGNQDFKKLVAKRRAIPDSRPCVAVSAPFPDRMEEIEEGMEEVEIEEEEVEEEVVEEEAVEDFAESGFDGRAGEKAIGGVKRPRPKGADIKAQVSIELALNWLAKHQDEDGRFDADGFMKHDSAKNQTDGKGKANYDVGVTGLALLAFLGNGSTLRTGPHKEHIKKAVLWLRRQQGPEGRFGANANHDFIYNHSIAAYAMCETYGLSQYKTLKSTAQKAIDYLETHRNPYAVWRYQPRDNDNDMSVTAWCVLAYDSAKRCKLSVSNNALANAGTFVDQLTDPETGRVGYTRRGEPSARLVGDHATRFPVDRGEAMTAAGLLVRLRLGQTAAKFPVMTASAKSILDKAPAWKDDGRIDLYYWHFASRAMRGMGDTHWKKWRVALYDALTRNQRKDGPFAGSWDTKSAWSEAGGRVYTTAMAALALEAYAR